MIDPDSPRTSVGPIRRDSRVHWPTTFEVIWPEYARGVAILSYDATRPFEILIDFINGPTWTVSRNQLHIGTQATVGDGDVRFRPTHNSVVLSLRSGEKRAEVKFPKVRLVGFLQESYLIVPNGEERVDIDELIELIQEDAEL